MTNTAIAPRERASALIAREVRAELGRQQMSNRRLAVAMGVSFMWVNRRISTGETLLTVEDTERIAGALGVPLQQLLATWLEHAPSPTSGVTGAYHTKCNTLRKDNVRELRVASSSLGASSPGVHPTTRTAAA